VKQKILIVEDDAATRRPLPMLASVRLSWDGAAAEIDARFDG